MAYTMPDLFKISMAAECPTGARTEIAARTHRLVIDEPPARHGTDLGPTPLETLLSAYLACTNVIANRIAEEFGITIEKLALRLTGHLDTRGIFNKGDTPVPFPRIDLFVEIATDASSEQVERLKTELARRCPVSRILREAGSEIVETWTVAGAD